MIVRQYGKPDLGCGAHLTVYWGCIIHADHIENYGQKGRYARNGVNLYRVKFNLRLWGASGHWRNPQKTTNPYRPSVWAMPSDDIPLIVESSEEFPARSGELRLSNQVEPVD